MHVSNSRNAISPVRRRKVDLSGLDIADIAVPGFSLRNAFQTLRTPLILAGAIWVAFPTGIAMHEIAAAPAGGAIKTAHNTALIEKAPAVSIRKASMAFVDQDLTTASVSREKPEGKGTHPVHGLAKQGTADPRPDEQRVTRSQKRGRLVKIAPVSPPKAFSAGSVFQRTSSVLRPGIGGRVEAGFSKMDDLKAALRVAQAFHATPAPQPADVQLPIYMAGLIVQPRPDRLEELAPSQNEAAQAKSGETSSKVMAYAAGPADGAAPFSALLKDGNGAGTGTSFIPPRLKGDHAWVQTPLPAKTFSRKELDCLANGVYFEARGESAKGQAAVAQVILNRVRSPYYPNTVCGVVYQNKSWRNRCQFSFACDGIRDRIADRKRWNKAREIGTAVARGETFLPEVGSATHYHETYVKPRWARKMNKAKKIGLHIFYRTKGGGWS